jgi:hypothetical protein
MKTDFKLPQKYADLGFGLSKVGEQSIVLRLRYDLVFMFTSGVDAREDFISRLFDCYLKLAANDKPISIN